MIDFILSAKQKKFRDMVRWFAKTEIRPIARKADTDHEIPMDFFRKIKKFGMSAGTMPKESVAEGEGLGAAKSSKGEKESNRVAAIGAEEMGWADAAVIMALPGPGLGGPPVQFTGTPEQKERYFGIFRESEEPLWAGYALTEPGAGSDVSAISTTCRKDGDHYIINGTKCFITNGARASWNVVFATLDKSKGREAHRAFVVEKGTPGARVGKIESKMGLKAAETAELIYEDCRVHKDCLLGGEAHYEQKARGGFKTAMQTFDATRPMVASMGVGIARAAYEEARDWAVENYELNRPIARYRIIKEKLAELDRRINVMRLMIWNAAWMADVGMPNTKEASMSKAFAGKLSMHACSTAIDIMGQEGLSKKYLVEKFFRDVKVFDIFEGTGQIQRVVISKRLIEGISGF